MAVTKRNLTDAILGRTIPGFTRLEVYQLNSDFRVTFYKGTDGSLLIAFYGTMNSLSDWIRNFQINFVNMTAGGYIYQVSQGAWGELSANLPKIYTMISTHQPNKIYVTGHSQGGMHSIMTTAILMETTSVPILGSSFEAPMAFKKSSADQFAARLRKKTACGFTRFVVPGDPVPMYPSMFFGYDHGVGETKLENAFRIFPNFKYHQISYIETIRGY